MREKAPSGGGSRTEDGGALIDGAGRADGAAQARTDAALTPAFQPVNTAQGGLDKRIVAYIQQLIETGELRSGDRLPAERELAAQLGVSRTVLREALHTLAAYGLVELQHGRGVFVAAGSAHAATQRLALSMTSDEAAPLLHDLFEIRRTLEGAAAEWAAERATPGQIADLRANLHEGLALHRAQRVDAAMAGALDARFHAELAAATNNRVLMSLMAALVDELAIARERSLAIPGRALRSLHQHEAVVMAIEERDAPAARRAMLEHLNDVEESILGTLPSEERAEGR
ncbi:MAG TPA: FCD domain-containing protein [Ktedonobacterales bacterium]|nr:FCD domain-containing protein [Ktedonobacterales bacterium]